MSEQSAEKDVAPASSWNYRVTRIKVDGEDVYEIREVYYTHGQPHSWSADPIAPHGESWHELAEDIVKMQSAVSRPALDLTGEKPRDMTVTEMVRSRVTSPAETKSDYVLDGSPEAVAIVREARGLPSLGDACLVYDDGTDCRDHLPRAVWCANCTSVFPPAEKGD